MTLTVALRGADGMVAASDSRATFGDVRSVTAQNDTVKKVFALAPHVLTTIAGAAELGVKLISEVEADIGTIDGVTAVMTVIRERTRNRYAEWFPNWQIQATAGGTGPARPDLAMLVAGYDPDASGAYTEPKIYQLLSPFDFAPMLTATGFGLQGVPQYALYLLNRLYLDGASIGELEALAAYVITETASQDGKVGGPVQMGTVTPADGCTILDSQQVEVIVDANHGRSDQLRSSFFSGAQPTNPQRRARSRSTRARSRA